ncbi:MAG: cobyrinic acid a,c-diamide synthase [Deltaproteobacteria bacterium]|nr:MAG: cobyrinic acid a,c-diamide synthase [Deltaproteobacteria bacterium]
MAKKVFIAATGQHCGKTTISLSLLHMARKKYERIGFMKPFGPKLANFEGRDVDMDAKLMARVYGLEDCIELMSPVVLHPGDTKRILDGYIRPEALRERIVAACEEFEKRCDFLVVEGAGHTGVGSVAGISNAAIARCLDAPVLMVTGSGIGSAIDDICLNMALFQAEGAQVKLVMPNKILPDKRSMVLNYLQKGLAPRGIEVVGGFNYSNILANPTLLNISRLLGLELAADPAQSSRIVHHVQLGAASTQRVVDLLQPSTLLVVTSTRDELLVMLSTLYHMPEFYEKICGMVITGVAPVSEITRKIIDDSGIPYLRCPQRTTAEIFSTLENYVSKITAEDEEKIALVQRLAEENLDFEGIDGVL